MGNQLQQLQRQNQPNAKPIVRHLKFKKYLNEQNVDTVDKEEINALFTEYLRTYVNNPRKLRQFTTDEEKQRFVGALLLAQFTVDHWTKDEEIKAVLAPQSQFIARHFYDGNKPYHIIEGYIEGKYDWTGTEFMSFDKDWAVITPEEMIKEVRRDLVKTCGITSAPFTFDTDNGLIFRSLIIVNEFCASFKKYLEEVDDETLIQACELGKKQTMKLTTQTTVIPFKSQALRRKQNREHTLGLRDYKRRHWCTSRLSYDVAPTVADDVRTYFEKLNCISGGIGRVILKCGLQYRERLTVISGPSESGKNTLVHLIGRLYEQYVCDNPETNTDWDRKRVVFLGDELLDDEETVKKHMCRHIVIVTEKDVDLPTRFGGRVTRVLKLGKLSNPDPAAFMKVSVDPGSVIRWCLDNNAEKVRSDSSERRGNSSGLSSLSKQLEDLKQSLEERQERSEEMRKRLCATKREQPTLAGTLQVLDDLDRLLVKVGDDQDILREMANKVNRRIQW